MRAVFIICIKTAVRKCIAFIKDLIVAEYILMH